MLRTRADLPDTLVGLTPMLKRTLHLSLHNPPQTILDATVTTGVRVNGRDHGTPHVVLALAIGGIADTHGPSALIAGQVVQGRFAERSLSADAVHQLQSRRLPRPPRRR